MVASKVPPQLILPAETKEAVRIRPASKNIKTMKTQDSLTPQDPATANASPKADATANATPIPTAPPRYRRVNRKGIIFSLTVIVAGALLLASKTIGTQIQYAPVIFSWPMLIVIVGLLSLMFHRRFSFGALLLVAVGFFLLIPRIGAGGAIFGWTVPAGFLATYWPVLVIFAGVLWLISWLVRPRRDLRRERWERRMRRCGQGEGKEGGFGQWDGHSFDRREWEGRYGQYSHHSFENGEMSSVFGSGKHIILDPEFRGGKASAVFGEIILDLRKTTLPANKTTTLEVDIVFGNAVVIVPESWNVIVRPNNVAGSFVDKREATDTPVDMTRTLDIQVNSVFGGGELRN